MTPDEIDSFITGHAWRFAKTMAHIPHSYVVKAKCRDAFEFEFRDAYPPARLPGEVRSRHPQYLDWPVNGVIHQFWTMSAPLDITHIINRAVKI